MGEDLVAFRDTNGRVGLMDERCHRGADMFFGRNEECGLRCVYHGWKFDVDGNAVDLPNVPPGVRHHQTMRIKTYPTREFGDVVWAYMGPTMPELPEVPQLEFGLVNASRRVMKQLVECNWAQAMEGDTGYFSFSFLHMPPQTLRRRRTGTPTPPIVIWNGCGAMGGPSSIYWTMKLALLPAVPRRRTTKENFIGG